MSYVRTPPYGYIQQPDATIDQANPVSGTEYQVLATQSRARIMSIQCEIAWTVQPTPLELRVYIDGKTILFTIANPLTATNYYANAGIHLGTTQNLAVMADLDPNVALIPYMLEGAVVRVTLETTGGTVQSLKARVKYALKD